jgi:hypothetical protein
LHSSSRSQTLRDLNYADSETCPVAALPKTVYVVKVYADSVHAAQYKSKDKEELVEMIAPYAQLAQQHAHNATTMTLPVKDATVDSTSDV